MTFETIFISEIGLYSSVPLFFCSLFFYLSLLSLTGMELRPRWTWESGGWLWNGSEEPGDRWIYALSWMWIGLHGGVNIHIKCIEIAHFIGPCQEGLAIGDAQYEFPWNKWSKRPMSKTESTETFINSEVASHGIFCTLLAIKTRVGYPVGWKFTKVLTPRGEDRGVPWWKYCVPGRMIYCVWEIQCLPWRLFMIDNIRISGE